MMNRVGIMGGTFNPIHNAHIELALRAYDEFELSKVLVMISPNPPHKAEEEILPLGHRVKMVKLAVEEYSSKLEFSDFELKRTGLIYTAETLTLLKDQNPQDEYYFIMGGDSIDNIEYWYKPEVIFENAVILAARRGNMANEAIKTKVNHLREKYNGDIRILNIDDIPVSSSYIRQCIMEGENISSMVSPSVNKYIMDNCLYKRGNSKNE